MKDIKIKIHSEQYNRDVQEALFQLGATWYGLSYNTQIRYINSKYLFVKNNLLSYTDLDSTFEKNISDEVVYRDLLDMINTKNCKMNTFNDLEKGTTVKYINDNSKYFTKDKEYIILECDTTTQGNHVVIIKDDHFENEHYITKDWFNAHFEIVRTAIKSHIISPAEATSIIDEVCDVWQLRLAKLWSIDIVLQNDITVTDELLYEGMAEANDTIKKFLNKIFLKDIYWDNNPLVKGNLTGMIVRVISHKDKNFVGVIIDPVEAQAAKAGDINHTLEKSLFTVIGK